MKDASKVEAEVEEDLYLKMKELEKDLEILTIQEEYIKDEQRHLKSEYIRAKEEVNTHFIVLNCLLSVD
jgi:26S proteasome regulatory subunit T3